MRKVIVLENISLDGVVGTRLFAGGTIPMGFKVTESAVTPKGVIVVNYEREGEITIAS